MYDCVTCGPLNTDQHDGRDNTDCIECIINGECTTPAFYNPAVKDDEGYCYWSGSNAHMNKWYKTDPGHRRRTKNDLPTPFKPLPGQLTFDGGIVNEDGAIQEKSAYLANEGQG